jgi:hypothetical protein
MAAIHACTSPFTVLPDMDFAARMTHENAAHWKSRIQATSFDGVGIVPDQHWFVLRRADGKFFAWLPRQ